MLTHALLATRCYTGETVDTQVKPLIRNGFKVNPNTVRAKLLDIIVRINYNKYVNNAVLR